MTTQEVFSKETIGYLLGKANAGAQALENNLSSLEEKTSLTKEETKDEEEKKAEGTEEEIKEDVQQNKPKEEN